MDNNVFLTNDILGNLTQRIAKTLPCLHTIDTNNIWTRPIELCQRIEENVKELGNVILEACKDNSYFANNIRNPINYQVLLVRVYILLYYRHSEEEVYKVFVFPELQKKMGIYNDKYLPDIQNKIKELFKIEQLIEKSVHDKKNNSKPKYKLLEVPESEADEYFSKFSNELLFRDVCDYLEKLRNGTFERVDVTSIWLTAKDVIQKLYQETAPEGFVTRIFHKLATNTDTGYFEEEAAEAVILCAYMMMRTITKTSHFDRVIKYIENIQNWQDDTNFLFDEVPAIKELMDEGTIASDGYDYLEDVQKGETTFTKADAEKMIQEKDAQIRSLKKQLTALQEAESRRLNELPPAHNADIEALHEEVRQLKEEIADMEGRQGIDAPKAALLVRIACTKLGGLPSNRENAWPLIANLWGNSESIARRRLKEAVKKDTVEDLAKLFDGVSPKIANIIREEGNTILAYQKKS